MTPELVDALGRIAELERKLDSMFRHGRVAERKYDSEGKRWLVRMRIGGSDSEPFLGPWVPYSQISFGSERLNIHYVPKVGAQMTMLAPAGDFQQALAVPMTWWNEHPAPSDKEDEVVLTFDKVRITVKGDQIVAKVGESTTITATTSGITLRSEEIVTDGTTRLNKGRRPVAFKGGGDGQNVAIQEGEKTVTV
jgi:phage baseplate assembly protein gpV